MKHKLLAMVLAGMAFGATAQSAKTVFESNTMVWFGLDFTEARMIGMPGESPSQVKYELLDAWNRLLLDEPEKFTIGPFFRKSKVIPDLKPVRMRNKEVDPDDMFSYGENVLTRERINALIGDFDPGENTEGLGLVFIIESFNKAKKKAVMHMTFFDIATRRVLLAERVTGSSSGLGMRNYWGNAIFDAMEKVDTKLYKQWKEDYGG